jgi:outer membrane immunogenic protein
MKKMFAGAAAALLLATVGAASAADIAPKPIFTKAPPIPVYNWTGFYIGLEGGMGWGNATQTDPTGFSSGTYQPIGGLIGGTIGYNWQFAGNWVFGVEGDGSWANISASTPGTNGVCGGAPANCSTNLNNYDTARARLGYSFGTVMTYATAGGAFGNIKASEGDIAANGPFGSGSKMVAGWTAGLGVECIVVPHWTVKLEGLYTDFGKNTVFNDTIGRAIVPQTVNMNVSVIRVGVNYKFN